MRRAMRHAHMMGCTDPLMHKLVPALLGQMGSQYPELERAQALITETLLLEETRFKSMLERGLKLLDEETRTLSSGGRLAGEVAFKLYDTYGFPLDLTQDALRARNIGVDTDGFKTAMERQRAEARKAWSGSGDAATEKVWFEVRDKVGASDFLGYATETAEGRVVALVADGQPVDEVKQGQKVALIANQTPFYGESGGQVGDTGIIVVAGGKGEVTITETQKKLDDMHVHVGTVSKGVVKVGDEAQFNVDGPRRSAVRGHHSATHLLHAALRRTLGDHVSQKGSLVSADRLRFDISHNKPLSPEEVRAVEDQVNAEVRANEAVTTRLMDPESAVKAGAMALFGEKYGEEVRVVAMGTKADAAPNFSVELCGGTHVRRTGDIGLFKIVGESAVAAGVRRIEAVTGVAAEAWVVEEQRMLRDAANALRVSPNELPGRIAGLVEERRKLEREVAELRKKLVTGGGGSSAQPQASKTVGGVAFAGRVLEDVPAKDLKGMADEIKKQLGSGVVALVTVAEGKASLVVAVSDDLTAKINAVELVKAGAAAVGGKGGGGRPDMAQAGGPEGDKAEAALAAIEGQLAALAA
jgi:alanyl-tRNA synthetase